MKKYDVQMALEAMAEANAAWRKAKREYDQNRGKVLNRLIHEAVANFMSAEEVAKYSSIPVRTVRDAMRVIGLDPREGKRVLSKTASEALASNAELLGVAPHEVDLMSPLAYLPMGEEMRQQITDLTTAGVTEIPETDTVLVRIDRETWEEHKANGECPVSSACCGCHLDYAVEA